MNPTRDTHATLVDLLDRVLDKGVVLDADLIIHVAGIPLLGVKLKAALAGMETMLKYGIWQDWDEAQRAAATEEHRRKNGVPLAPGEEVILKILASQWHNKGIYYNWRPGQLYITNKRVLLFRKEPAEVLFQCPYEEIEAVSTASKENVAGKETDYVCLLLRSGEVAELHSSNALAVKDAIKERIETLGPQLEENFPLSTIDGAMAGRHKVVGTEQDRRKSPRCGVEAMPIDYLEQAAQSTQASSKLRREEVKVQNERR